MLTNRGEVGFEPQTTVGARRECAQGPGSEELTQIKSAQWEMKSGGPSAGRARASEGTTCTIRTLGSGYSNAGRVATSDALSTFGVAKS